MIDYRHPLPLPRFHHVKGRPGWLRWKLASFPGKTFAFRGASYRYFGHVYNHTWKNERAVEIPVATRLLRTAIASGQRVLEVGNVLSHYMPVGHEVIDKYESAPGVLNQDIVEFRPDVRYDLVLSVSTLEHVGQDETPARPGKAIEAVHHIVSLLAHGGSAFVTIPVGHNRTLDAQVLGSAPPFTETYFLKRISPANDWLEVDRDAVRGCEYGHPYPYANALVIGYAHRR